MSNNNNFLSEFDQMWGQAKAPESKDMDAEIPDGKYIAMIDRVEFKEAKNTGNRYLSWGLKVLEGPHTGRYCWKRSMLNNATSLGFLKKDLMLLGLNLERLSDLNLELLLELQVSITKKTRVVGEKSYSDVYINSVVSGEVEEDKEIPF